MGAHPVTGVHPFEEDTMLTSSDERHISSFSTELERNFVREFREEQRLYDKGASPGHQGENPLAGRHHAEPREVMSVVETFEALAYLAKKNELNWSGLTPPQQLAIDPITSREERGLEFSLSMILKHVLADPAFDSITRGK